MGNGGFAKSNSRNTSLSCREAQREVGTKQDSGKQTDTTSSLGLALLDGLAMTQTKRRQRETGSQRGIPVH